MRYSFEVTIPKDTAAIAPHEEVVRLEVGTLTQIMTRFRVGCHGLVYVAVYDGLEQIAPATGSTGINGNGELITVPVQHELTSVPYSLTVKGWSDGTRYAHKVSLWFDVIETAKREKLGPLTEFMHLLKGTI